VRSTTSKPARLFATEHKIKSYENSSFRWLRLNPGDLSWDAVSQLGELTVYDRTSSEEVIARSAGAEAILTNKTVITAEIMSIARS
jgi:hypothetical protein